MIKWECRETVGMAMPNPTSVVKMPIPPEVAERWEREAKAQGISLDDYFDALVAEAEEALDARREDPAG